MQVAARCNWENSLGDESLRPQPPPQPLPPWIKGSMLLWNIMGTPYWYGQPAVKFLEAVFFSVWKAV